MSRSLREIMRDCNSLCHLRVKDPLTYQPNNPNGPTLGLKNIVGGKNIEVVVTDNTITINSEAVESTSKEYLAGSNVTITPHPTEAGKEVISVQIPDTPNVNVQDIVNQVLGKIIDKDTIYDDTQIREALETLKTKPDVRLTSFEVQPPTYSTDPNNSDGSRIKTGPFIKAVLSDGTKIDLPLIEALNMTDSVKNLEYKKGTRTVENASRPFINPGANRLDTLELTLENGKKLSVEVPIPIRFDEALDDTRNTGNRKYIDTWETKLSPEGNEILRITVKDDSNQLSYIEIPINSNTSNTVNSPQESIVPTIESTSLSDRLNTLIKKESNGRVTFNLIFKDMFNNYDAVGSKEYIGDYPFDRNSVTNDIITPIGVLEITDNNMMFLTMTTHPGLNQFVVPVTIEKP